MTTKNKLLSVLSDAEQEALYGLPDFDDAQQLEYLALTEAELAYASSRPGLHAQVYCLLQIGYFKVSLHPSHLQFSINPIQSCSFYGRHKRWEIGTPLNIGKRILTAGSEAA